MHLMHVSFELHRSFAEDAVAEFAEMVIEWTKINHIEQNEAIKSIDSN